MWYDKGPLLSYRKFLNFIYGNRGGGKTYAFKRWSIDDFKKNGSQFVWVRRYKSELKEALTKFTNDIIEKYPEDKIEIKGNVFYVNEKIAGYFIPLSVSTKFKSNSFPLVNKIIFDEFLIDKSTYKYLQNEVIVMLDLIETIFRVRDTGRVFFIGNAISASNPYFLYFGLEPSKKEFFVKDDIIVQNYKNKTFIENKLNTRFGKLIAGTEYGEYAIENEFLLDNSKFIKERTREAKFRCAIFYKGETFGFWVDFKQGDMYACLDYDPSTLNLYTLTRDDHNVNMLLIKNIKGTFISEIRYCFQIGHLFCANQRVKSKVFEILSFFLR